MAFFRMAIILFKRISHLSILAGSRKSRNGGIFADMHLGVRIVWLIR
jgi:hypothetical protein